VNVTRLLEWLRQARCARSGRREQPDAGVAEVAGERPRASLAGVLSVQARATNLLALGLMTTLGTGALAWYYVHAARRTPTVQERIASRAPAEMVLPPLGPITGPDEWRASAHESAMGAAGTALPVAATSAAAPIPTASAPSMPPAVSPEITRPLTAAIPMVSTVAGGSQAGSALSPLERRLSGAVFASASAPGSGPAVPLHGVGVADGGQASHGELSALLSSNDTAVVHARLLGDQRLLLARGAFIDCTLETAIDSSLPGMTTCITATDIFGTDGSVVLLERGTKLVGETRGQVQQGTARLFVLWIEARTPGGVIVPLDSPGTDTLGRSGVAGEVDRHFWQRFGAALLITTIDGTVQAAVQSGRQGGGTLVYNSTGAEGLATEALRSTVNLPPTVSVPNGDRVQVLVARDVDFSAVYQLRHVEHP
jgi:type IV secretion system protein VirB10